MGLLNCKIPKNNARIIKNYPHIVIFLSNLSADWAFPPVLLERTVLFSDGKAAMINYTSLQTGGDHMFNFKHLLYFNAVYQYKNFTQAGDSLLSLSQPFPPPSTPWNPTWASSSSSAVPRTCSSPMKGEQFILWVRKILTSARRRRPPCGISRTRQISICSLGMSYSFMANHRSLRSSLTS